MGERARAGIRLERAEESLNWPTSATVSQTGPGRLPNSTRTQCERDPDKEQYTPPSSNTLSPRGTKAALVSAGQRRALFSAVARVSILNAYAVRRLACAHASPSFSF
uniref:Uncharacterized protein n=1 Tax=Ascaris lumbricoides TaxID=6252 RepID=A0A0M3HP73_ASCLU